MKKAGQIFILFMLVCLMVGLAACGSNATSGPSSENGTDDGPLDQLQHAFERLTSKTDPVLKIVIKP